MNGNSKPTLSGAVGSFPDDVDKAWKDAQARLSAAEDDALIEGMFKDQNIVQLPPPITEVSPWAAAGVLLYGALYLLTIIGAGLVWGDHVAVIMALAALGICYCCVCMQVLAPKQRVTAILLWMASISTGVAAGIDLMLRTL